MKTPQIEFWNGDFGKEYTDRNPQNLEEWDNLYKTSYGLSKTEMNDIFLKDLPRDIRILEVGCNIGLQLLGLQRMGFTNLYGVEIQEYAVEKAKSISTGINIVKGSGFDIPFKDGYFDLVYTAGVLIHISPNDLSKFMSEMVRCSKKYIWGFEYYSQEPKQMNYRGNEGFLWKSDFEGIFRENNKDLKLISEKKFPYISKNELGNIDIMYLLEKNINE